MSRKVHIAIVILVCAAQAVLGQTVQGDCVKLPGEIINLSNWKLTLPIIDKSTGKLKDVATGALTTFCDPQWFRHVFVSEKKQDAVSFYVGVHCEGITSNHTKYCRTEMREMKNEKDEDNWCINSGVHELSSVLKVAQIPSNGKVIIGQIHADNNGGYNPPLAKLEFDGVRRKVYVSLRTSPTNNAADYELANGANLKAGDWIEYTIRMAWDSVTSQAKLTITINGASTDFVLSKSWITKGLYFKAGAYIQDNEGPDSEGVDVVFTKIQTKHQDIRFFNKRAAAGHECDG